MMQLKQFAVIGIGANTSEAVARLEEWSAAYGHSEWFSFCHVGTGAETAALSLDEVKMAVLLFEADDKGQVKIAWQIAARMKDCPHPLVVGIAAGNSEVTAIDSLECLKGEDESRTRQWVNAAKALISPMLMRCMTSVDYHDLRTVLSQSGTFRTYAGGVHNSIAEAVEELTANEGWATILHSQRKILSIHATSATLSTMEGEMLDPFARLKEQLETAGEAFKWGIYEDPGMTEGKFRIEIIAAKL